jgi:hypothetical protein
LAIFAAIRRLNDRRIGSHELVWAGLKLGRGRVVATVEPDAKSPSMYRVHCCKKDFSAKNGCELMVCGAGLVGIRISRNPV